MYMYIYIAVLVWCVVWCMHIGCVVSCVVCAVCTLDACGVWSKQIACVDTSHKSMRQDVTSLLDKDATQNSGTPRMAESLIADASWLMGCVKTLYRLKTVYRLKTLYRLSVLTQSARLSR